MRKSAHLSSDGRGKTRAVAPADLFDAWPADITIKGSVHFTPTFILLDHGTEIGRIEGYPGDAFFWPMLVRLLDKDRRKNRSRQTSPSKRLMKRLFLHIWPSPPGWHPHPDLPIDGNQFRYRLIQEDPAEGFSGMSIICFRGQIFGVNVWLCAEPLRHIGHRSN